MIVEVTKEHPMDAISQVMKEKKINKYEMARRRGTSRQAVGYMLKNGVRVGTFMDFAEILNCKLYLVTNETDIVNAEKLTQ